MITDEMIAEAAAELNEAMIKSLPDPHECKHQFSKKFERKMDRLIYRVNHPIRYKIASRVASILLVILIGFTVVMSCSPTARAAVIGWIKQVYESFYSYYFEANTDTYSSNKYQIDPLPEGYAEISHTEENGMILYVFANGQNEMFIFAYSEKTDSSIFFVEKEGYSVEETEVLGCSGDLYTSEDGSQPNGLIWYDLESGYVFYISGQFDGKELINFAGSVKKCPN